MGSETMKRRPWAWLLVGLLVGAAALYAWNEHRYRFSPGGFVSGFERRNDLIVFAAHVVPVVTDRDEGMVDLLDSEQTAIIPGKVIYTIAMRQVTERDVRWDVSRKILSVTIPDVSVQKPNLDERSARYYRKGVWSPATTQKLTQKNSQQAEKQALEIARGAELVTLARQTAVAAVSNNGEAFLRGAGFDGKVEVHFRGK